MSRALQTMGATLAAFSLICPSVLLAQASGPSDVRETARKIKRSDDPIAVREARLALQTYGRCAATRTPGEARRVMLMDFKTTDYRTGLRVLGKDAEEHCAIHAVGAGGRMQSSNLLFAGAVAEGLLVSDAVPLNVRLARKVAAVVPTFGPTDAVAQCLARSMPDQTAAVLSSEPASNAEASVAQQLMQAAPACARAAHITRPMDISVSALRAMVATASYRIVAS